jgi:hypothetical protein
MDRSMVALTIVLAVPFVSIFSVRAWSWWGFSDLADRGHSRLDDRVRNTVDRVAAATAAKAGRFKPITAEFKSGRRAIETDQYLARQFEPGECG